MSKQRRLRSAWQTLPTLPVIGFFVMEWRLWRQEQIRPCYGLASFPMRDPDLVPYPLDIAPLLALPYGSLDEEGIPFNAPTGLYPAVYHPTTIVQYGLACWNAYLATGDEEYRQRFMKQVHWLLAHEVRLTKDADDVNSAGGWPMPFAMPDYDARGPWLSALIQGNAISAFVRAYRLTREEVYLQAARRAVRTFELDVRNGGVSASIGEDGVFFEEVAVYPASHILNGGLFALFGLYDYVALTREEPVDTLCERGHRTLHEIIDKFDTGSWTRYDLRYRTLASRFYHALHAALLTILAQYADCDECAQLAERWASYTYRFSYYIAARLTRYRYRFRRLGLRGALVRFLRTRERIAVRRRNSNLCGEAVASERSRHPTGVPVVDDIHPPRRRTGGVPAPFAHKHLNDTRQED